MGTHETLTRFQFSKCSFCKQSIVFLNMSKRELWSIIENNDEVALRAFCEKNSSSACLNALESDDGFSPIFSVCLDPKQAPLIPILVTYGKVDVNSLKQGGLYTRETPLIFASIYGNAPAVAALLQLGADKTMKDWKNFSALNAASYTKMKCRSYGGAYWDETAAGCDAVIELLGGEKQCALCFAPSTAQCAQCKIAHYCSREHQKQHWKEHKLNCNLYCKTKPQGP